MTQGIIQKAQSFARDDSGASLVEFGLIVSMMLFLVFGLIDFGRLGFSYVMAQKATERAVREAVVRSPACPNVPLLNGQGGSVVQGGAFGFGAQCSQQLGLCADPGLASCTAENGTAVASEIFEQVRALLPTNATPANLYFSYAFEPDFGFLGGPYTPLVTVEIIDLDFEFVTPMGALGTLVGANTNGDLGDAIGFPNMSNSLPAEILNDGESA